MIPRHQGSEPSIWQIAGLRDQLHRTASKLRSSSNETDYRTWLIDLRDGAPAAPGSSSVPVTVSQLGHYLDQLGTLMGVRARRQAIEQLLQDCDTTPTRAV